MRTLKKDFELRKKWYSNRSSTIYPLDIDKGSDFCLSFINYWKLKNKIFDLKMNLRFYDEKGNFVNFYETYIVKNHKEFFFKKIIGNRFKGMVGLIISSKSLSISRSYRFYLSKKYFKLQELSNTEKFSNKLKNRIFLLNSKKIQ